VTKDEVIKTLHFDSETGMPQYDPVARKVYRIPTYDRIGRGIDHREDVLAFRLPSCPSQADRTSSSYSGAISVFHQDDADHYRKVEDFRVQHAVHTVAVDMKTHKLYTPEQEEAGSP